MVMIIVLVIVIVMVFEAPKETYKAYNVVKIPWLAFKILISLHMCRCLVILAYFHCILLRIVDDIM